MHSNNVQGIKIQPKILLLLYTSYLWYQKKKKKTLFIIHMLIKRKN